MRSLRQLGTVAAFAVSAALAAPPRHAGVARSCRARRHPAAEGRRLRHRPRRQVAPGPRRGRPSPRTKPIFWEWRFRIFGHVFNMSPMLAVRDGKWKLLMNPDRSRVELYDIPADPREMNNVAGRHPEAVERLAKLALPWQKTLPPGLVELRAGKNDYPWPGRK